MERAESLLGVVSGRKEVDLTVSTRFREQLPSRLIRTLNGAKKYESTRPKLDWP